MISFTQPLNQARIFVAAGALYVELRRRSRAALGLLLGGAPGNLSDRLFRSPGPMRGRVVDWINLPHFPWTFNLADSAICCAAALIVVLTLLGIRMDGAPATEPSTR